MQLASSFVNLGEHVSFGLHVSQSFFGVVCICFHNMPLLCSIRVSAESIYEMTWFQQYLSCIIPTIGERSNGVSVT